MSTTTTTTTRTFLCSLFLLTGILYTFVSAADTKFPAGAAVVVDRNPITLQLSRVVNATGMRNLVARDRARAKALRELNARSQGFMQSSASTNGEPLIDVAFEYIAMVGVGNPPTSYKLIVDTGSSNTWIGAGAPYVPTSTSNQTGNNVSVTYGSGFFSGKEYVDQITLTSRLVIPNQSIGVASYAPGFNGVDGILGLGPVNLTIGTLSPNTTSIIPTVTDNLYADGLIHHKGIGVFFRPTKSAMETNGELTWGGIDPSNIISPVTFIPVTTTFPASNYWGFDQSIHYGTTTSTSTSTTILSTNSGLVDTGTTLVLIATDAWNEYASATGAVFDGSVGLLSITPAQYANLKSLFFKTRSGPTFELIPNAQIWPRSLNTLIGGKSSSIYLIIADIGSPSGQGFDFINGFCFLQRYYSVYDSANRQIGFAHTRHTRDETN